MHSTLLVSRSDLIDLNPPPAPPSDRLLATPHRCRWRQYMKPKPPTTPTQRRTMRAVAQPARPPPLFATIEEEESEEEDFSFFGAGLEVVVVGPGEEGEDGVGDVDKNI